MLVFGFLPTFLMSKDTETTLRVGIIDETGALFTELQARIEDKYKLESGEVQYHVQNLAEHHSVNDLRLFGSSLVAADELEGYFIIPASFLDSAALEYRSKSIGNFRLVERFSSVLEDLITEHRFRIHNIDPTLSRTLIASVDVKTIKVTKEGEESDSGFLESFFGAYFYVFMLMFMVMTSGQLLIRGFVEEKSNRVIEVLLSSISAKELMLGKILGLTALGLVQVSIWVGVALAVSIGSGTSIINAAHILLGLVFFLLGYLLYVSIFVGFGSTVTTEQEAQQATSYISLFLVFPIVLAPMLLQNANAPLIKILSFIPTLTPSFMLMRLPIQMPELWEIAGTIAVLVISNVVCIWIASKIFRLAILSYGKRPSLRELMAWIRSS